MTTLHQKMESGYSNNLNLIKLIASILVIYSHSYYICYGEGFSDPINTFTNGKVSFGAIAVAIFLFVSGLYVSKSLEKSKVGKRYFGARMIRIFPLLILVVVVTTFVIGPIITEVSIAEYFTDLETYQYLLYIVLIPVYSLTGVFKQNPTSVVNGPLWTLILEMICYCGLFIAYKMGFFKKKQAFIVLFVVLVVIVVLTFDMIPMITLLSDYIRPFTLFFIGMLYYIFRDKIKLSNTMGVISLLSFMLVFGLGYYNVALLLFLPYCICWVSYLKIQCSNRVAAWGIYAYGIYLVGYPIQQILRLYMQDITPIMNTIGASIIAIILAILMNKYIEEPSINYFNEKWRKMI